MCTGSKPKAPEAQPIMAAAAQAPPMSSLAQSQQYADAARKRRATGGVGTGTILTSTRGVTDRMPTGAATDGSILGGPPEITKRFVTPGKITGNGPLARIVTAIARVPGSQNDAGDVSNTQYPGSRVRKTILGA